MPKCNNCGAMVSERIVRADGLPSGVGLVMDNGKTITLCADCLMAVGTMSEKSRERFFERLTGEDNDA